MCGVAAIFAYHSAAPAVDRDELRRIRDHMVRRGPDGKGEWFSGNGRVALGHRRLSIIDLTERGAQPMASADGKCVVSFNGEIYNHKELRRKLEAAGRRFRSNCDTEVLLHLYAEKGDAMVQDLRGMFAFALWDADRGAMLLARDPYGVKPLYYADDGWTVRVASQVKALHAGGAVSRISEPAGLVGFLLFGSVPEPFTTYQEIRALPAGGLISIGELGPSAPKKWCDITRVFHDAAKNRRQLSAPEVQRTVREGLLDSVRHHLVADVPVGAFLSAGIDSATLVGLASELTGNDLRTITLAFEEFRGGHFDEAPLAQRTAGRYGTQHTTHVVTQREFEDDLPAFLAAMDQPSIDGVNTWFVSKAAAAAGLKVALSGLGGDELFGGYPSFRDVPRWVRRMAVPSRVPLFGDLFRLTAASVVRAFSSQSPKIAGLVKYGGSYPGAYLLRRGLFMPWELSSLVNKEIAREGLRRLKPLQYIGRAIQPDPELPFARIAAMESCLYMRNQLLRDADWASMAHSLEVRTPLVDAKLLRAVAPALMAHDTSNAKSLMANSPEAPLDPATRNRAKTGFTVPIEGWLGHVGSRLDVYRRVPMLRRPQCHWARRLAYGLLKESEVGFSAAPG